MSNESTWRSKIGGGSNDNELIETNGDGNGNGNRSEEYSALEAYLGKNESHEQIALGYGSSSKKNSLLKHIENLKDYINKLEKDLRK